MREIIDQVAKWAGGNNEAMVWYRTEPLPPFGCRTAESLVKTERRLRFATISTKSRRAASLEISSMRF
jgi:hypothetical protein